jgi:hypothetical protein
MDLSTIKTTARDIELTHPKSGAGLGWVFHVLAPDADEVKSVERDWTDKRLQPKRRNKGITTDELDAVKDKKLLTAVTGWTWVSEEANFQGEQIEFSPKALRNVLKIAPWIRDQLVEELEDVTSFF